jgi:hypothetical protein
MASTAELGCAQGLKTAELAEAIGLVTDGAGGVARIDDAQLQRLSRLITLDPRFRCYEPAQWDDPLFWNADASTADRSQFFAIGNAINFRFWELRRTEVVATAGVIDGIRLRGAMYMWRCLRRSLDIGRLPLLDAEFLSRLSERELEEIFVDDAGVNPLRSSLQDRLLNLRDLGSHLLDRWDGSFYNLVASTGGSLVRFVELSRQIRAFDDPVLKLTMVNAILHSGSGVYTFRDEPLPGIDYHLLRHLLRQGVVEPNAEIREKLTGGRILTAEEGVGLRKTALRAFVELARLTGLSGEVLDNRYWMNRTKCTDRPVCLDPGTAPECPFLPACSQRVSFGLPLEETRYY